MNSWTQPSLLDFLQPEPPHNQPAGLYCTQCDEPSPTRYEFVTTHARDQYGVCVHINAQKEEQHD